ncbi:MAG TPA: DNA mismatch repair protein MutS [Desulfobacteraceae bacterium]|nr:DNA mismatch repair protein MutS [Desulfobacteraceae bacterium]
MILPIEDYLDLHTFNPKEIPYLIEDYIDACMEKGIFSVRIIHGKGQGFLRNRVQGLLDKNPNVISFQDAPPEAGGWGATLAELKREKR